MYGRAPSLTSVALVHFALFCDDLHTPSAHEHSPFLAYWQSPWAMQSTALGSPGAEPAAAPFFSWAHAHVTPPVVLHPGR